MKIIFGTHNKNKLEELIIAFKALDKGIEFCSLDDFPEIGDIEETGNTLEENALIKARTVNSATGLPTLSDDTGLEVSALHGAPGVFTARYAGEGCSYSDNVNKILKDMEKIPVPNRNARFRTVIAYVDNDFEFTTEGYVDGLISRAAIGDNGFGYDPVFYLTEKEKTFAQMTIEEKQLISHRGRAISSMIDKLNTYLNSPSEKSTKEMA